MTYNEFMRTYCKNWDGKSPPKRVFRTAGVVENKSVLDALKSKSAINVNTSALAKPGAMLQVIY